MNKQHWQDWITTLVGIWVFLTPWVIPYFFHESVAAGVVVWNHYIVGLVIAVIGVTALTAYQVWEEWVDGIAGLWLIASPWVLGYTNMTAFTWNAVIMGVITLILSASVIFTRTMRTA